jgi:hypothetical protein
VDLVQEVARQKDGTAELVSACFKIGGRLADAVFSRLYCRCQIFSDPTRRHLHPLCLMVRPNLSCQIQALIPGRIIIHLMEGVDRLPPLAQIGYRPVLILEVQRH